MIPSSHVLGFSPCSFVLSAEKEKKKEQEDFSLRYPHSFSVLRLCPACPLQPSVNYFIVKQECTDIVATKKDPGFLLANKLANIINILSESSSLPQEEEFQVYFL